MKHSPSLKSRLLAFALVALAAACSNDAIVSNKDSSARSVEPVDPEATAATRALLKNLHTVSDGQFLFGHQDTMAYGVLWYQETGRSDVRDVTGDYPALYGWDLGHLELGADQNLDDVSFRRMQEWMTSAYARGGVVSISWHMNHPVTGKPSWDTAPGAKDLLPGGESHSVLKAHLDRFADFVAGLTVETQAGIEPMPIIFRPWHEHNGDWFWWGTEHTSEEDYIKLWRFTVDYLVEEKQLHNLLFAFSPDRSRIDLNRFAEDYLYAYPGDDYVDILGLDNYWDLGHSANDVSRDQAQYDFVQSLTGVVEIAEQKGKIAAMTEGGQDTLFDDDFWTERLLAGLLANQNTRQLAYVQVWRNANREREERDHFYVPYPGHPAEADFIEFYQHPSSLFESDLPDMYRLDSAD